MSRYKVYGLVCNNLCIMTARAKHNSEARRSDAADEENNRRDAADKDDDNNNNNNANKNTYSNNSLMRQGWEWGQRRQQRRFMSTRGLLMEMGSEKTKVRFNAGISDCRRV